MALPRFRPAWVWPTAVSLLALSLILWLIVRAQLPVSATALAWSASGFLPDWTWHIDPTSWSVSFWLLLVSTAVSLHTFLQNPKSAHKPTAPAAILLLTAATLSAIWSDSFTGLLAGLTLLLGSWLATLWLAGERSSAFRFKGTILLMALLLAWPIGSSRTALLAAALLLNVWPLPLWQPKTAERGLALASLTPLLPPLAGALLLMHLLPVAQLSPGVSLLLTVLSLIGFFRGVQFAWNRLHLPSYAVTALLLAQSHLLLLAAIWVGATGVLAELRGLLLAGAALYLLVQQPNTHKFVRLGVGSVTLAALAGVPLTATFAGRAGLYTAWLADGRWPLVLVLALLHVPLIMAGIWLLRLPHATSSQENRTLQDWLREAAPIVPAVALFSFNSITFSAIPLMALLFLAVTAVAGILLPQLVGQPEDVRLIIRQALGSERPSFAEKLPSIKQLGAGLQTAINDAADILDGDSGLLWLLALAVIIILTG